MWRLMLLVACVPWVHSDTVTILTEYGDVVGRTMNAVFDGETTEIMTFNGVPFATPPLGNLRFQKPEKDVPWAEAFDAEQLGSSCPQDIVGFTWLTHPGWTNYDEDCLNMNIAAPADISGGPYPVMIFFHGGGFTVGANIQYPGHFLATRGVIAIAANYRLGNLGFAYSGGDGAAPGNAGLWDQAMALEFIKDNIAQFGGDPDKVTVYGQSAGAASSSLHMVSPQSAGRNLIHQAILESGTENNFWSMNWPDQQSVDYLETVATKNDCPTADHFEMVDCLQQVNAFVLANTSFECRPGHFCQGMAPVIDGLGGFLPELPHLLRESGSIMEGPIITGINRDDGSLYTTSFIPESNSGGFNETEFEFYIWDRLLSFWAPLWDEETGQDIAEAMYWNYKPWPYVEDEYANRDRVNELVTDGAFGASWNRQAREHSKIAPVYGYIYDYRGRNNTQIFPEWMGVPHMGEIPYIFGLPLLKMDGNEEVRNNSAIVWDVVDWTEEDQAHAIYFIKLLTNFVKTGNPTPQAVEDPLGGFVTWPQYTDDNMAYMYISNTTIHSGVEWRQKDYAFWQHYFAYLDGPDMIPMAHDAAGVQSDWVQRTMEEYMSEIY